MKLFFVSSLSLVCALFMKITMIAVVVEGRPNNNNNNNNGNGDGIVSLQLSSTGCEYNCITYADNTSSSPSSLLSSSCSSSILINGVETSGKKDGFNMAVINTRTGHVTTAHFRWMSATTTTTTTAQTPSSALDEFLRRVDFTAVLVIVFQNMCRYFQHEVIALLMTRHEMIFQTFHSVSYQIATIVACKYSCPNMVKGRPIMGKESIPYTYVGPEGERGHKVSLSFRLGGTEFGELFVSRRTENVVGSVRVLPTSTVLIPAVCFVLCGLVLLVGILVLRRRRRRRNRGPTTTDSNRESLLVEPTTSVVENRNSCAYVEPVYADIKDTRMRAGVGNSTSENSKCTSKSTSTSTSDKFNLYIEVQQESRQPRVSPPLFELAFSTPSAPPLYLCDSWSEL